MRSFLLLALVACAHATPASPPAVPTAAAPLIHPFKIGVLDAFALHDGDITVPNDGTVAAIGQPTASVNELLTRAGAPTDKLHLSIQPLLVRDGDRAVLFDTGAASASFAVAGKLPAALAAAGVAPSSITDVFISHGHPDHVGGLVTATGALAFPSAEIHLSAAEWTSMQASPEAATIVAAIRSNVTPYSFPAGVTEMIVIPHVTALATPGHTPGHAAYRIDDGDAHLLYIGDVAHHYVLSVQRPAWSIEFDRQDDAAAKAMRQAVLEQAAASGIHVYAVHFPFPGLGHITRTSAGFAWKADVTAASSR